MNELGLMDQVTAYIESQKLFKTFSGDKKSLGRCISQKYLAQMCADCCCRRTVLLGSCKLSAEAEKTSKEELRFLNG